MNQTVNRHKSRLDELFNKINTISDIEMQAQWACYLCVLVSGFIEESLRSLIGDYARAHSSRTIANYVEKKLSRETNLNMPKIVGLLSQFDPDIGKDLEHRTNGELKDAIDSIVANRNNIVHGRDVSLTYTRIHDWYKNAVKVIKIIEELFAA